MQANFVFDIDGTIAVVSYEEQDAAKIKSKFGAAYFEKHSLSVCGQPYYIFPGFYALFQWLDFIGGNILFFSAGLEVRNVEFI